MEHPGRLLVPSRHFFFFFLLGGQNLIGPWTSPASVALAGSRLSFLVLLMLKEAWVGLLVRHFTAVGLISLSVNEG